MERALEDQRPSEYLGVRELADAAERILRELQPEQTKGTVSDYPNERTIRFYLSEGLLPAPTEKRGQSSLFRYHHLITLLVIKKLQSEGLPISVIKSLIADRGVDELEKLLGERVVVFTQKADLDSFIEMSGKGENEEVMVMTDPKLREDYLEAQSAGDGEDNKAKEYLSRLLYSSARPSPPALAPHDALQSRRSSSRKQMEFEPLSPGERRTRSGQTWTRLEIAPGLELHLADVFELPRTARELDTIIGAIKKALKHQ